MSAEKSDVLVVGGGPAGLRAAEIISAAGRRTMLADHKPSVGRKFLVAGRGGLNLTHSEPVENFPARYDDASGRWQKLLADFSPDDLARVGEGLGVETFVGTSGRVFPDNEAGRAAFAPLDRAAAQAGRELSARDMSWRDFAEAKVAHRMSRSATPEGRQDSSGARA